MRRREFIALLGGAAAGWPVAVSAQSGTLRRVGIFMDLSEQDPEGQTRVAAFRKGLQDLGWTEGRNVKFDTRWTAGDPARMRRYAAELVGLAPEVIMQNGWRVIQETIWNCSACGGNPKVERNIRQQTDSSLTAPQLLVVSVAPPYLPAISHKVAEKA